MPKIILSQDLKTTFKQDLICMKKTQYQFSFVHFAVDDPVGHYDFLYTLHSNQLKVTQNALHTYSIVIERKISGIIEKFFLCENSKIRLSNSFFLDFVHADI